MIAEPRFPMKFTEGCIAQSEGFVFRAERFDIGIEGSVFFLDPRGKEQRQRVSEQEIHREAGFGGTDLCLSFCQGLAAAQDQNDRSSTEEKQDTSAEPGRLVPAIQLL